MTTMIGRAHHIPHLTAAEFGMQIGSEVTARDSTKIGTVADLRGPYFKVRRGLLAGHCWLDIDDVLAVMHDQVVVEFGRKEVTEHRIPDDVVKDDRTDARSDHLLDDTQLSEQRARMERELEHER